MTTGFSEFSEALKKRGGDILLYLIGLIASAIAFAVRMHTEEHVDWFVLAVVSALWTVTWVLIIRKEFRQFRQASELKN